jgi:hypothetical protein
MIFGKDSLRNTFRGWRWRRWRRWWRRWWLGHSPGLFERAFPHGLDPHGPLSFHYLSYLMRSTSCTSPARLTQCGRMFLPHDFAISPKISAKNPVAGQPTPL